MSQATAEAWDAQMTALQIVVGALAYTLKDDPAFQKALANLREMEHMKSFTEEQKVRVRKSIDRLIVR